MRGVIAALLALHSSSAALRPGLASVSQSSLCRPRAHFPVATSANGHATPDGDYTVGSGSWGQPGGLQRPAPKQQRRAADGSGPPGAKAKGKRSEGTGRAAAADSASGSRPRRQREGSARGSPVLDSVLRKMTRLAEDATVDDVDGILRDRRLTARDYTTVINALRRGHNWRVAVAIGEWLVRRSDAGAAASPQPQPTGRRLPNSVHYLAMMAACADAGQPAAARRLADEMQSRGLPLGVSAAATLVHAHERAGEWERTVELLDEVVSLAADAPDDAPRGGSAGSRAHPLCFAYTSAIRAHSRAGKWEAALRLYERLGETAVAPDAHCHVAALEACRRGKQPARARELLAAVRSAEGGGGVPVSGAMYNVAMAACNAGGEWSECLALLAERRSLPSEQVGHAGRDDRPPRPAPSPPRPSPPHPALAPRPQATLDPYAYSVAMAACVQGRDSDAALNLLTEMKASADEAIRANPFAWNEAIVACNRASKPDDALRLYDEMRAGAAAISEHSVAAALVACRSLSDWQRAQAVFDGAKSCRSLMCYNSLLDALSDGEQWSLVLRYFDAMRADGAPPDEASYERAIAACDRVDPDRALVLFAQMKTQETVDTS